MLQAKLNLDKTAGLTQQLRRFSADHVKINKEDTDQAKRLVDSYLKNGVLQYIFDNSQPLSISKLEYTGSLYERLKTEAADEVDVMVVLQTAKQEVIQEDAGVPGFVLLKVSKDGSPLKTQIQTQMVILSLRSCEQVGSLALFRRQLMNLLYQFRWRLERMAQPFSLISQTATWERSCLLIWSQHLGLVPWTTLWQNPIQGTRLPPVIASFSGESHSH